MTARSATFYSMLDRLLHSLQRRRMFDVRIGCGYAALRTTSLGLLFMATALCADIVLIEGENFSSRGGWVVDQQFVQQMGSPFLLAHGLGDPVADATTDVNFPSTGIYHVWVRTRDWVPDHTDDPGRFRVCVAGEDLGIDFGTELGFWHWQDGGVVNITSANVRVELKDLTGFDGRCDALAFLSDINDSPPNTEPELGDWRSNTLGLPLTPSVTNFDCVVVGGGLAGCSAAIAAAREGISVALIQDRPVLGGNASQEIRVGTQGEVRHSIVTAVRNTHSSRSDGIIADDANRLSVVQAETNIHIFLNCRAYGVVTNATGRILAVDAKNTRSGEERRFQAPLFIDCTGDGWIGYWAGADFLIGREASSTFGESRAPAVADTHTMGHSLMWSSYDTGSPVTFPEVPWALTVAGSASASSGGWNWEYGFNLDIIEDAEEIRDYLLRAIYGNFYNEKQKSGNSELDLYWVPYVAGKRESRRLQGDHILVQDDVMNGVFFEDAVATGSWTIDLHIPTSTPYRSEAIFTSVSTYYFPFRSLYSRNVPNLMMAGRCLSASHVGLGSPRVMHTCGQMGVAVGYAASLCKKYGIDPRDIYRSTNRTVELQALIGGVWPERPMPSGSLILDNEDTGAGVVYEGGWTLSTSSPECYGDNYRHDGNSGKGDKFISYTAEIEVDGEYDIAMWWPSDSNRASNVPVEIATNTIQLTSVATAAPYMRNTQVNTTFANTEMLVGRVAGSDYIRGLLDFDLSALPANAVIVGASLTLTASKRDTPSTGGQIGDDGIRVYQLTESFVSAEVTWSERDDGVSWSQAGGTFDADPIATYKGLPYPDGIDAGDSIEFEDTGSFVRALRESIPAGHISMIVRTPSIESSYDLRKLYRFSSQTFTNAAWRPILSIRYHLPSSNIVTVNQRIDGEQWNNLGTYNFLSGQTVSVIIRNDETDGYVMADAVRFNISEYDTSDADYDGLPNWWERWYFFDETAADPDIDSDGDGRSNYSEYRCGTDPLDALSVFMIKELLKLGSEEFTLTWPSSSNRVYSISTTTNMLTSFKKIVSNIAATPPENTYTVSVTHVSQFYRISVE